jgi:hypothetical protein
MGIHVPSILVECTGPNFAQPAETSKETEHPDSNHLSTFTNDLLMWSPNTSTNASSTDLHANNNRESSASVQTSSADSSQYTVILGVANGGRLSTSADSGYHESYPHSTTSYDRYQDTNLLVGPTTFSNPIASDYGYPHRHTNHVVNCILCGLESYRKFQDRMGWPHHLEHADYEDFKTQISDPTPTRYRKIYPHLTTDDNYTTTDHRISQSFVTRLTKHQYYRSPARTALIENESRMYSAWYMSRIGRQIQCSLSRLVGR